MSVLKQKELKHGKTFWKGIRKNAAAVALSVGVLGVGTVAFASTWTNAFTTTINANTNWVAGSVAAHQTTNVGLWDVHTISRTMASVPRVRLVNWNGEIRGAAMNTAAEGRTATGSHTGSPGYAYWAQFNPAWNQVTNNQSIRVQLRVR